MGSGLEAVDNWVHQVAEIAEVTDRTPTSRDVIDQLAFDWQITPRNAGCCGINLVGRFHGPGSQEVGCGVFLGGWQQATELLQCRSAKLDAHIAGWDAYDMQSPETVVQLCNAVVRGDVELIATVWRQNIRGAKLRLINLPSIPPPPPWHWNKMENWLLGHFGAETRWVKYQKW